MIAGGLLLIHVRSIADHHRWILPDSAPALA